MTLSIDADLTDRDPYDALPFTSLGYIKLLSSPLYPSKYEIRPIEDRGAICDSIRNGGCDLFARVPVSESFLAKTARIVGIVAAFVFIQIALAPTGALYHLASSVKHCAYWIVGKDRQAGHGMQSLQHFAAAIRDGVGFLAPLGLGIMVVSSPFLHYVGLTGTVLGGIAVITGVGFFVSGDLKDLGDATAAQFSRKDGYGFYKSLLLREEFGLVSKESGGLLAWNPQKDSDVTISHSGFDKYFYLGGYFIDLHKEQAQKLLSVVQDLQKALPSNHQIPFAYPPEAEEIIAFVKSRHDCLSDTEIDLWTQKLQTAEANKQSVWDIVSKSFTATSKETKTENYGTHIIQRTYTYTLSDTFPLTREECQPYFFVKSD